MAQVKVPVQKIILCGEYGSGKSSLFRRFTNNSFVTETDRKSTIGLDHVTKEFFVKEKSIKLQLWDTGGMERIASVTSSYYKFAEAAILVFALDNPSSFHSLSQHLLDIVTYAENAKVFICGNKSDLEGLEKQVSDADLDNFCEQCHGMISGTFKTSCKTNSGVQEMFQYIAEILNDSNRSKIELQALEQHGFRLETLDELQDYDEEEKCSC